MRLLEPLNGVKFVQYHYCINLTFFVVMFFIDMSPTKNPVTHHNDHGHGSHGEHTEHTGEDGHAPNHEAHLTGVKNHSSFAVSLQ